MSEKKYAAVYYKPDKDVPGGQRLCFVRSGSEDEAEARLRRAFIEDRLTAGYVCQVLSTWSPKLTKEQSND